MKWHWPIALCEVAARLPLEFFCTPCACVGVPPRAFFFPGFTRHIECYSHFPVLFWPFAAQITRPKVRLSAIGWRRARAMCHDEQLQFLREGVEPIAEEMGLDRESFWHFRSSGWGEFDGRSVWSQQRFVRDNCGRCHRAWSWELLRCVRLRQRHAKFAALPGLNWCPCRHKYHATRRLFTVFVAIFRLHGTMFCTKCMYTTP